jgi:ABC-type multidrug transport system ATPase subunit
MLEPTSGRVTIQGLDNQLQIEEVRHYLGFCPQYGKQQNTKLISITRLLFFCLLDILYDELSVEEHLELIAKVKEIFLFFCKYYYLYFRCVIWIKNS